MLSETGVKHVRLAKHVSRLPKMPKSSRKQSSNAAFLLPLLLFPIILIAFFYLIPADVQSQFAFNPQNPVWYTYFTAGFFHLNADHLAQNLAAYIVIVLVLLVSARTAGKEKELAMLCGFLFLAVPLISSLATQFVLPQIPPTVGASGIVFSLAGLMPAFAYLILGYYNPIAFMASFLLTILYVPAAMNGSPYAWVAVFFLNLLLFAYLIHSKRAPPLKTKRDILNTVFCLVLPAVVIQSGFPANLVQNGVLVGIFDHYIGLLLGLITGWLALPRVFKLKEKK